MAAPERVHADGRMDMTRKGCFCYLIIEILLLCLIQAGKCIGWSGLELRIPMYAAILANTVIAARHFDRSGADRFRSPERYLAFALFATAGADFFMTLIGKDTAFLPGVILFCLVQMIYALYLRPTVKLLLIRAGLFAACLLFLKRAGMLSLANAMGILDLSLLLVNVILSWMPVNAWAPFLFRIGITLFLCCDLSILLRDVTAGGIQDVIDFLVWIFYIPSQAALTLSYLTGKDPEPQGLRGE